MLSPAGRASGGCLQFSYERASAGLATTLDHIVEDLEDNDTAPPEGLARIVGVETSESTAAPRGTSDREMLRMRLGSEPDILFSKPANAEQYEIAARLAKSNAVLVQGPPGTGKTQTIANLLGCLLTQGKTVLGTAHTTKVLRVLRDQLDDALKPLCLSVLDSDPDSHAQLSRAAQEIASRLSTSDAASLRRNAGLLREKRTKFLDAEEALRRQLRDARFSEVEEVVIGGEALSPIEVAKRVKADAQRDGGCPVCSSPALFAPSRTWKCGSFMRLTAHSHPVTRRSSRCRNQRWRNLLGRQIFACSLRRRRVQIRARTRIAQNYGLTALGTI
jgi:hypothetical protein